MQQCQRKRFQVEPADSFGVLWIKAMAHDTVLPEFVMASVQFALR